MQRVCRDTSTDLPVSRHQPTVDLLQKLLLPHDNQLFALPREGADKVLEWWTSLEGQPQPYNGLDEKSQATLLDACQRTLGDLHRLGDTLRRQGKTSEADLLEQLPRTPNTQHLYSLNGSPLLTHWYSDQPDVHPPVSPPPPVTPPPAQKQTQRPLWLWLLALLALLALLLALWWWTHHPVAAVQDPVAPPAAAPTGMTCVPRPADEPPPELVIVFDTSSSMDLKIGASKEDEDWIFNMDLIQRGTLSDADKARFLSMFTGPSRAEVAKQSLINLVNQLPENQAISMVTFDSCMSPTTFRHGPFPGNQHARLTKIIQDLPIDGGTPLADSIETAAAMVDGKDRDAIIVVFLDGEDGCGRDQCAAAAAIAKAKPRLKFNVVDISGRGLSDCIAKSTGGHIYSTEDATEIAEALRESVREVSEGVSCH